MQCPSCSGENTTEIQIRLKTHESVRFHSCRRCEHKWWKFEGDEIALGDVLSLTSEKQPAKV